MKKVCQILNFRRGTSDVAQFIQGRYKSTFHVTKPESPEASWKESYKELVESFEKKLNEVKESLNAYQKETNDTTQWLEKQTKELNKLKLYLETLLFMMNSLSKTVKTWRKRLKKKSPIL